MNEFWVELKSENLYGWVEAFGIREERRGEKKYGNGRRLRF